jgi:signal transduction histidine kinase
MADRPERYRLLVLGQDDLLLVLLDPDGRIVRCSAGMDRVLGVQDNPWAGRSWSCLFPPEEAASGVPEALLAQAREAGRAERDGWLARPGGRWLFVRMSLAAYHDHRGSLRGYALFGQELSAQEPAWASLAGLEQDLAARTRQLRELEGSLRDLQRLDALGVLAGGIAHDLNNLLGAVGGGLELAAAEISPARLQIQVRSLQGLVSQSTRLVRRLLAFAGRRPEPEQRVDLNELVRELVPVLAPALPRRPRVLLDLFPSPLTVRGEPVLLQQVVLNLVLNAAEAMSGPAGLITLQTYQAPSAPDRQDGGADQPLVGLEVRDNGCGMVPEVLDRLFEPFFTTKPSGHGLGLHAMQGIVRRHRGNIRVTSQPGQGSCFTVMLPLAGG